MQTTKEEITVSTQTELFILTSLGSMAASLLIIAICMIKIAIS